MALHSIGTPGLWVLFLTIIFALLAFDLGVFHKKAHVVSFREALRQSAMWIALALLFNVYVFFVAGKTVGLEFLTGYVVEKALSVDNIFVFIVLFRYFQVPRQYQHRVLFYGILGALFFRGLFILLGAALIQQFHWILYVFGALLIFTGLKLLRSEHTEIDVENNLFVKLTRRIFSITPGYVEGKFFVRQNGVLAATPLLLVLVAIEATDIVFAVDSIPAIFAITQDPFIVFSSNIFAILGLRALYFVLEGAMGKFHLLKFGLAFILCFIGAKMLIEPYYDIPIGASLGVIGVTLFLTIVLSLVRPAKESA